MDVSYAEFVIELNLNCNKGLNDWRFTLGGEEKKVTERRVKFVALTIESGLLMIKRSEIVSIQISQKFT